ncbi:hypothetical protein J7J13_03275 [bacterium]|nr:hypothetical protein [bacterium]
MSKVKPYGLDYEEKKRTVLVMFEIIGRLRTKKEIVDFLLGLLTTSEALMVARRIEIAVLILKKKSFSEIKQNLKVGNNAIQQVEKWFYDGDEKYKKWLATHILPELKEKEKTYSKPRHTGSILNRYSHHRFLKDLLGL